MDWRSFRIAALLLTSLVVLEVNSEFQIQVRDHNSKNGTIKWHTLRRQKREWIKFAAACREGEDNSKRNPIAKGPTRGQPHPDDSVRKIRKNTWSQPNAGGTWRNTGGGRGSHGDGYALDLEENQSRLAQV